MDRTPSSIAMTDYPTDADEDEEALPPLRDAAAVSFLGLTARRIMLARLDGGCGKEPVQGEDLECSIALGRTGSTSCHAQSEGWV